MMLMASCFCCAVFIVLVACIGVLSQPLTVNWTVNVNDPLISVSPDLFGIFFEEINRAGHGGLHQQQIDNSNFETNFKTVSPWTVSNGGRIALDQSMPLNSKQPTALRLDIAAAPAAPVILTNPGFWGFRGEEGLSYNVTLFVRSTAPDVTNSVIVSIDSANGRQSYGSAKIGGITTDWQKFSVSVACSQTDYGAVFNIVIGAPSAAVSLFFDVVTVMPLTSYKGLTFVRPDIAAMLDDIHPAFVRFPGGCYIENNVLANRFNWKNAVGPPENRTGHFNGVWYYYTETGLGLFEYLQWIETLTDPAGNPTRVIWVVNNGVSMQDSVDVADLAPYLQDALDSVNFAIGDSSVPGSWAAIRAQMGHPAAFRLDWIAIGNEDCGNKNYEPNYLVFYDALMKNYPQIKLIANCEIRNASIPVQYWDFHTYPTVDSFLSEQSQHMFDSYDRKTTPYIFNSEYASHGGPIGNGNLYAAIGEAVWMAGLQRNSDLVKIASYAPLLENMRGAAWHPNMIRYVQGNGGHSIFGTPSYWNQWMYAHAQIDVDPLSHQTLSYQLPPISSEMTISVAPSRGVSLSTGSPIIILKIINYGGRPVDLQLSLLGFSSTAPWSGKVWTLSAMGNRSAENSLENPLAVSPVQTNIMINNNMTIFMGAYSIMFVQATTSSSVEAN